jgi:hypothetical protein
MEVNFNEMVHELFEALDDTVLAEYYNYEAGLVDYPSETALNALRNYQDKGFGESKALQVIDIQ